MLKIYPIGLETFLFHRVVIFDHQFLQAQLPALERQDNFDLEKRLQSEDRAHRIGQDSKVTYVDLVAPKTVDENIVKALRNKLNLAQEVLGDEKWKSWLT